LNYFWDRGSSGKRRGRIGRAHGGDFSQDQADSSSELSAESLRFFHMRVEVATAGSSSSSFPQNHVTLLRGRQA
jgi:hypothetical protein